MPRCCRTCQVSERLLIGPHTAARDLASLRRLGVSGVVSLSAEVGPVLSDHGIEYHWESNMAVGSCTLPQLAAAIPRCDPSPPPLASLLPSTIAPSCPPPLPPHALHHCPLLPSTIAPSCPPRVRPHHLSLPALSSSAPPPACPPVLAWRLHSACAYIAGAWASSSCTSPTTRATPS